MNKLFFEFMGRFVWEIRKRRMKRLATSAVHDRRFVGASAAVAASLALAVVVGRSRSAAA